MKFKKPKKSYAEKRISGNYTSFDKLPKSNNPSPSKKDDITKERLTGCIILRDGEWFGLDKHFRSHSEVRMFIGDENPYEEKKTDSAGFITSEGRILTRVEASVVAANCGQVSDRYRDHPILSSDILKW